MRRGRERVEGSDDASSCQRWNEKVKLSTKQFRDEGDAIFRTEMFQHFNVN